jgi:hypothetical protein
MNYLSFSLWGDNPMYNVGTIRNAELWKEVYPDWQMVVYYDNTVPKETIDRLDELGVLTIDFTEKNIYGMFWRFFAHDLENAEYCVFRDSDSRITVREKMAVDEWIESKKSIHIMRDHPAHGIPFGASSLGILGGMWGIKTGIVPLSDMILKFVNNKQLSYGADQTFLQTIYSIFKDDQKVHDEFFEKQPFPIKREYGRFVGDRIDENDKPVGQDYLAVI